MDALFGEVVRNRPTQPGHLRTAVDPAHLPSVSGQQRNRVGAVRLLVDQRLEVVVQPELAAQPLGTLAPRSALLGGALTVRLERLDRDSAAGCAERGDQLEQPILCIGG